MARLLAEIERLEQLIVAKEQELGALAGQRSVLETNVKVLNKRLLEARARAQLAFQMSSSDSDDSSPDNGKQKGHAAHKKSDAEPSEPTQTPVSTTPPPLATCVASGSAGPSSSMGRQ